MSTGKTFSTKYILDSNNNKGANGQVLSSTSSGIDWTTPTTGTVTGTGVTGILPYWTNGPGGVLGDSIVAQGSQRIQISSGGGTLLMGQWDGSNNRIESASRPLFITSYTSPIKLGISGNTTMTIESSNVGIGTTSPGAKLEVNVTDNTFNDINVLKLKRTWATGSGSDRAHGISFNDANSTNATIYVDRTNSGANYNSDLLFATNTGTSGASVSTKMVIKADGNVGIGTSDPTEALMVEGWIRVANNTGIKFNTSASSGDPTLNIDSGAHWNFLNTAGNNLLKIDNGGNVGIGTTSPDSKLDVTGGDITINTAAPAFMNFKYGSAGSEVSRGTITTDGIDLKINSVADLLLLPSGTNKVGVGTTSPNAKLEVTGATPTGSTGYGDNANSGQLYITSNAGVGSQLGGRIAFGGIAGNGGGAFSGTRQDSVYGTIEGYKASATANHAGGGLSFKTNFNNTGALIERMNINQAGTVVIGGNVGIGTTSPGKKLDVAGDWILDGINGGHFENYTYGSQLDISELTSGGWARANRIATSDSDAYVFSGVLGDDTTLTRAYWTIGSSSNATGYTYSNGIILLKNGNVGIGTTSPGKKLEVNGSFKLGTNAYIEYGGVYPYTISTLNTAAVGNLIFTAGAGSSGYESGITLQGSNTASDDGITFTAGSSAAMVIQVNGNVGIGTTSPGAKLDVAGSVYVHSGDGLYTNDFRAYSGSDITFHNTGNTTFAGNVGIGTTSPGAKLDIVGGGISTSPTLELNSSTSSTFNHAINAFNSNLTTGENQIIVVGKEGSAKNSGYIGYKWIGDGSNDNLVTIGHWASDNLVNIDALGNVGIGTTSPSEKLQVAGIGEFAGALRITESGTSQNILIGNQDSAGVDTPAMINGVNGNLRFGKGDSWSGEGGTFTEAMRIVSSGNVGIGTTSPDAKLEVVNSVDNTTNTATDVNAGIIIHNGDSSGTAVLKLRGSGTDSGAIVFGGGAGDTSDKFHVISRHNQTKQFTVQANGNVGIGTTDPGYRLEVDGGIGDGVKIKAGNAASKDSLLVSTNNDVSKFLVQGDGKVIINSSTGISGRTENFQVFGKQIITNTGTDGPVLYLGYNSSGSNTIQLGRGRTADGLSYMDFNGEVMSAGQFGFRIIRYSGQNASTELNHIGTGAFKLTCTNSADIILNPNSGSVGISQTNPSHKLDVTGDGRFTSTVTATNFILSSDERLKENVEKVCDNRVEADWKTFELKTEKGKKRYGVIAQELEKTNPEFVREDNQGFKSVAYIDLLIAKIAELEARLEKLEK